MEELEGEDEDHLRDRDPDASGMNYSDRVIERSMAFYSVCRYLQLVERGV